MHAFSSEEENQTEVSPILGRPNSVDCHFEISLKATCISLNDVKGSPKKANVRLDGQTLDSACRSNRQLCEHWSRTHLAAQRASARRHFAARCDVGGA